MNYPGRVIKQGETDSSIVAFIAKGLQARGFKVTSPPGQFGAALASDIKLFQSQNVDAAGRPLKVDGNVGPLTWGALFGVSAAPALLPSLAYSALQRAISQIDVREDPAKPNTGPEVNAYLKSVNVPPGSYWCMAFVNWCFQNGAVDAGVPDTFPVDAGCINVWNIVKSKAPQRIVTKAQAIADPSVIKPGFVFILDHGAGRGHTGFVKDHIGGALRTVEGNTNDNGSANGIGVFELNRRSIMDKDLKGFLDYTV